MKKQYLNLKNFFKIAVLMLFAIVTTKTAYAATNTTMETATPLIIGQSITGKMEGYDDEYHYYKFTVPQDVGNQWIQFSITNYGPCYIQAYLNNNLNQTMQSTGYSFLSKNDSLIFQSRVEGAASTSTETKLVPGNTYYIIIDNWSSSNKGDYVLSVSSTPDDNWGTFDKAEALTCNQTKTGKIEYKDDIDCYAITLPNDGALHNFILNSDQKLYALFADANGIKISDIDVNANITNNRFSATGTGQKIYIRVEAGYGVSSANYSIKVISEEKKISTETTGEKKEISTLKLTSYKKNSKKIVGKTISNAVVKLTAGKKTYKVKSNKSGKFTVKLKKKIKSKDKIKVTVTKANYKTITKTFKVK